MKPLVALTLIFSFSFPSSVFASNRTIFAATASGTNGAIVILEVSPGLGLNINLIPTGEIVKKAWIDDPSQITLSFDGEMCTPSNNEQQQECTSSNGATVVHLRQIKPIKFSALPRNRTGLTLLTLVAEGASGRKLYQFKVAPISGEAKYTTLTIAPNPEKLTPIVEQIPTSHTLPNPNTAPIRVNDPKPPKVETRIHDIPSAALSATDGSSYFQQAIINANAAAYGLVLAQGKGQIILSKSTWIKTQQAIEHLRKGKTIESAAISAKLPIPLLKQLILLGQQRL